MKTWSNKQHEVVLQEKKRREQEKRIDLNKAVANYLRSLTRGTTHNKSDEPTTTTLKDYRTNF